MSASPASPAIPPAPPASASSADAALAATPTVSSTRERLLSLDVFRGITIAGMLLVNDPGSWSAIYPPLQHAEWHGWTPTDLIFPFFLWIVGITTWISIESRRARDATDSDIVRQIVRRGLLIVLIGLLLNAFPFTPDRWEHLRFMGVLQRIGIAYLFGALLSYRTTLKQQVVVIGALLIGYFILMTIVPVPGESAFPYALLDTRDRNLAAWVDRAVIGVNHTWANSKTWDPEGILSTIPAIGTLMLGVIAGRWISQRTPLLERIAGLFAAGCLLMVAGLMWNWSFPINKNLWTSSYVLFTAGMAAAMLATCMWIIDHLRVTGWTKPFVIYGVNPIVAFAGSGMMARLIYSLIKVPYNGKKVALESAIYQSAYASWLPPRLASLAFAVTFVLFWLGVLWILYRRKIFLKV